MNKIIKRKKALWIVALIVIMASTIATADFPCRSHGSANLQVDDSDLDLSRHSEAFTLYQRLQNAAMKVCDPSGQGIVLPVFGLADVGDCYSDTLTSALVAYDSWSLNDIHDRVLHPPIIVGFD